MSENKKVVHVMIDVETTGLVAGCGVWDIGGVAWVNPTSALMFSYTINPLNILDHPGLKHDKGTLSWQNEKNLDNWVSAQKLDRKVTHLDMLQNFAEWLNTVQRVYTDHELQIWSKGNFDFPILKWLMNDADIPVPWTFREENDLRTVCNFYNLPVPKFAGAHSAQVDAHYQAQHLQTLLEIRDGK